MKKFTFYFLLIQLLFTSEIYSQNYQTVEEVNSSCAQLGFMSNEEAEVTVDKVMSILGLPRNFIIQECPKINNAIAKILPNEKGTQTRYILYDNVFFDKISGQAETDWAATSILAHEIGHHLSGHALSNKGSTHQFELEADYFSGFVLAKMGADEIEAQSAIKTLKYEKATASHPAKIDRLNAIAKGWGKGKDSNNSIPDITEDINVLQAEEYYRKGKEFFLKQEYIDAIYWYKKAASEGNIQGINSLGNMYDFGIGVAENDTKALEWFIKAAEKNDPAGMSNLGTMYWEGVDGVKNFEKAFYWTKQAAESGVPIAMNNLGLFYLNGVGTEKNEQNALMWIKKSANLDNPSGYGNLGYLYDIGAGTNQDHQKAFFYYKKAAKRGNDSSMYNLGMLYFDGLGVEKNYDKALEWFKKSANKGNSDAMNNIGYFYQYGYSVLKNRSKAVEWYQKAAKLGHEGAKNNLLNMGERW